MKKIKLFDAYHTSKNEEVVSERLSKSELSKISDYLTSLDPSDLMAICDELLIDDEEYQEDRNDFAADELVEFAIEYIEENDISLDDVKSIVESNVSEANADGTISDDEDKRREELLKRVKSQMEELLASAEFDANDIGGPFRSPGIMYDIRKELEKQIKKFK